MRSVAESGWLPSILIALMLLPVTYILSVGPALWLYQRKIVSYDVLMAGWESLLCGHRYVRETLHPYSDLWVSKQCRDNVWLEWLSRKDTEEQARQQLKRRHTGREPSP